MQEGKKMTEGQLADKLATDMLDLIKGRCIKMSKSLDRGVKLYKKVCYRIGKYA